MRANTVGSHVDNTEFLVNLLNGLMIILLMLYMLQKKTLMFYISQLILIYVHKLVLMCV